MASAGSLPFVGRGTGKLDMWRATIPFFRAALLSHRRRVVYLVLIGASSGLLATIKSELEAGVIQHVSDTLQSGSAAEAWGSPLSRFAVASGADLSWDERITRTLLFGVDLGWAVGLYLSVAAVSAVIAVAAAICRSSIRRTLYGGLYQAGLRKALITDPTPDQVAIGPNPASQQTAAVQQGSGSIANAYAFWAEAAQYMIALGTAIAILWSRHWAFGVTCLAIVVMQVLVSRRQAGRLEQDRNAYDDKRNKLSGRTDDVLTNRDIILAHERQDHFQEKLDRLADEYADQDRSLAVREERYRSLVSFLTDVGRLAVLLVGLTIAVVASGGADSVGDVYFLISIYGRLLYPTQALLSGYDDSRRSQATARTLIDLLERPASLRRGEPTADTAAAAGGKDGPAVVFDRVRFSYPDKPGVLNECTFHVPTGATTLLVGRSGCGKTTIARMLLGFGQPEAGRVTVWGRDLQDWNPDELRLTMSYLAQARHVVDDTVRENLFAPDVDDADMLSVIEAVGLHALDSRVLDRRAADLSGGEQQRLALARILVDKSSMIIMDEPLAGVDAFTFAEVRGPLRDFLRSHHKTVLIVSHRLAFSAHADHVVVLGSNGTVVEEGSPAQLVTRGGEFSRLRTAALSELTASAEPAGRPSAVPAGDEL